MVFVEKWLQPRYLHQWCNQGDYSKTQRDQRKTSKDHSKENRGITPDSLGILIKKLKIHMKVKKSELGGILWEPVH